MREPWRRLIAWLLDWATILAWVGVVAAVGVPLYLAGILPTIGGLALNLVGGLLVVVPATLGLALQEAGRAQATLGKRALGLRVVGREGRIGLSRALLRSTLKVALPWAIGHAAVIAMLDSGGSDAGAIALLIAAYVLPALYLVMLFLGTGRPLYDRLSGTTVLRSPDASTPSVTNAGVRSAR